MTEQEGDEVGSTSDDYDRVRQAIYEEMAPVGPSNDLDTPMGLHDEFAEAVSRAAGGALTALAAAGYVVVPREPTEEMVEYGCENEDQGEEIREIWEAMIAAAEGK